MNVSGYARFNDVVNARIDAITSAQSVRPPKELIGQIEALAAKSREIHERDCFNLNPATNLMNPRAEALLASGIGTRPSLGLPGDKYEMGLEAIEEIEVISTMLAAKLFNAKFAEIRIASGALANMYAFMAMCKPGDQIIAPPPSIGGHVTHHDAGCAGLYGLKVAHAAVAEDGYTVDIDALKSQAHALKPKLITIGGSLNLDPHPIAEIVEIAREVGAKVLFDAAHQCGMIAGKAWENPLDLGVDAMTMSTYKSLGGPPSGLLVTNDEDLARRIDAIAYPGLTANFDVAKSAALGVTIADWLDYGQDYAVQMVEMAQALAGALESEGISVFATKNGATQSHQFAVRAAEFGGGQTASKTLRKAGFLACGIGLPIEAIDGDLNGLRIGTPELVRIGMTAKDAPKLAALIARALRANAPEDMADEVSKWRQSFTKLHFIHG
jgi:glycine hydroxymethyltransferase